MEAKVNIHAFSTRSIASNGLCVLSNVVHIMPEEGYYNGKIFHKGIVVRTFILNVSEEHKNSQVDIDLFSLPLEKNFGGATLQNNYNLMPKGYIVLYVSEGDGRYSIILESTKKRKVYNTAEYLIKSDLFVVTLLRPGIYKMIDKGNNNEGQITVKYPIIGKKRFIPNEPIKITVTEKGFSKSDISLNPSEAVLFQIDTEKSMIVVDLLKPDDGPKEKLGKQYRKTKWKNPNMSTNVKKR